MILRAVSSLRVVCTVVVRVFEFIKCEIQRNALQRCLSLQYSSVPKLSSVVSRNPDFHEQQVTCFRFDVFPGELVSNSALVRVTILSLVSVFDNIFEQAPSFILFHSRKNTKIISCNLTSTNVLI